MPLKLLGDIVHQLHGHHYLLLVSEGHLRVQELLHPALTLRRPGLKLLQNSQVFLELTKELINVSEGRSEYSSENSEEKEFCAENK